jgi:hypothetical protein
MNWEALKEAIKEPLRWLFLAILPFGIAYVAKLDYSWAGIVVVVLRMIDKYLHETAPKGEAGGLVRF